MKVRILMDDDDAYDGPKGSLFETNLSFDNPEITFGNLFKDICRVMALSSGQVALQMVNCDFIAANSFGYIMGRDWSDPEKKIFRDNFNQGYVEGDQESKDFEKSFFESEKPTDAAE